MESASGATSRRGAVSRAQALVGLRVVNLDEEEIGRIEEIMIDTGHWQATYAVLSLVPLMGMGDRFFPVPWKLLRLEPEEGRGVLELHREQLKTAPCFLKNDWPRMTDREWAREIHGFYGERPYWEEATAERRGPAPGRRETDRIKGSGIRNRESVFRSQHKTET